MFLFPQYNLKWNGKKLKRANSANGSVVFVTVQYPYANECVKWYGQVAQSTAANSVSNGKWHRL